MEVPFNTDLKHRRRKRRRRRTAPRKDWIENVVHGEKIPEISVQNVFSRSVLNVPWCFACVPLQLLLLPFLFFLPRRFFVYQLLLSMISSRARSSSVSLQVIPVAFSSWRIFALCLVISRVSLTLIDLWLTLNFGWSRSLKFTVIWFHTSPLSLLLCGCW